MQQTKHEFSLYYPQLSELISSSTTIITLTNQDLYQRIVHVLRLQIGEKFIVFDRTLHAQVQLQKIEKNQCIVELLDKKENLILRPTITALVPLLKREDLETVIYDLIAVGVTTIQLVVTQKIQRAWGGEKELARLNKIMIAAAEQAKCYAFATLNASMLLPEAIREMHNQKILKLFADPQGKPLADAIPLIQKIFPEHILLLVGPEGDLTIQEKELVQQAGFDFYRLTPTILRSSQAMMILAAFCRSLS